MRTNIADVRPHSDSWRKTQKRRCGIYDFLAASPGIWQSDYRRVGGWMGGRKETAMSEPTYPQARITKFGKYIAHPLQFICAKFHDQIRIGRHSKSRSRETTPIRNGIFALMRPPQLTAGLLVHIFDATTMSVCLVQAMVTMSCYLGIELLRTPVYFTL